MVQGSSPYSGPPRPCIYTCKLALSGIYITSLHVVTRSFQVASRSPPRRTSLTLGVRVYASRPRLVDGRIAALLVGVVAAELVAVDLPVEVQRVLTALHRDRDTRDAGAHTTSVPGQLRVTYTSRQRLWPVALRLCPDESRSGTTTSAWLG